ncbi:MAG: sigma-70 family RNA polymerase sigma factor [Cellulomonas sp.]|uniref:sigma-70 family RNA polymerase sigma factor n=1 Tax=Cellulomonas sp. TaxID=40001 RepID=UPI0019F15EEF|nr:sigma-70 family RNA polymerase sigma factor [Cellulomonas sp.]MBF0689437.1 sigma-70 family RNA polymerase sigma factor [Cellulomonas sp.]
MATGGSDVDVIEDDAALLRATREGDAAAFGRLYERHAGAALVVARQYSDSAADAEDVVSDAFANVHRALRGGGGPESAFRAYLFTVVRRVATVHRTAGRRTQPTDDVAVLETASTPVETAEEPTLAGFERSVVARAFRSLPERWREVLWHSEVEGLTPAQIAPIVGLTANSTAALAYRAREGLRQAYLQQHLQDPLDDGCRAVAGKLGSHVRGGLGARDTRQVEGHLEECGECRALVLELGDVNHGMRAVVAPLVLGLLGLGALAHELPVGGGLAAGAAALAQQGGAAASGGTGAGAAAGGTGAAGGGGAGAAATGTGAAVGSTAAGATAAAGTATGVAGVFAGVSAGAIAAAVAVVAVVAVVIVGAAQLLGGPDDVVAEPTPGVSGASQTGGATPSADATPSRSAAPSPTAVPEQDDDAAEPREAGDDASDGGAAARPRAAGPAVAPVVDPVGVPGAAPTAEPTTGPTVEPTAGPTPEPTPTTDPPPAPADVVIAAPEGGIELIAGVAGQAITLTVSNAGGQPAAALEADVALPSGVTLTAGALAAAGFGFSPADATAWSCVTSADEGAATCALAELAPGQDAVLSLTVAVDESYSASGDEEVRVRMSWDGGTWKPDAIRVRVAPSLARLTFGQQTPSDVQLVAGRSRVLQVPVRNAGGTGVTVDAPAVVELRLPAGVSATASAPWSCTPDDDGVVTCRHRALAAFESSTLDLVLTSASGTAPDEGSVHVRLMPSAHRPVETHDVRYRLVRPAVLSADAPTELAVAPGTPAAVAVTVANDGDLAAAGTTLTLTAPAGATLAPADGDGWTCSGDGSRATCTAGLDPGASRTLTTSVEVPVGTVGPLGAVTVGLAHPDADIAVASHAVALTAVEPVLSVSGATAVVDTTHGGTLAFVVGVSGARDDGRPAAAAADVRAAVTLPPGVTIDRTATGGRTEACTGTGRTVTCALGELSAGETLPVEIRFRAAGAVRGAVDVLVTATGARPATTSTQVVVSSANLTPVWSGVGDLEVVEVGAPLLLCVDTYALECSAAHRESSNNGLDMRPIDQVPPEGDRPRIPVSSETYLHVPDSRPVVWAGLYWSGVIGPRDAWSGPRDTARLRAPDGTWSDVTAGSVTDVSDASGRRYYQAAVEVTDLVARGGGGAWALADVAVSDGRTDRDPSYYAGWSLVVVHGTPAAPGTAGAASVTVHQGGAWIGTSAPAPAFAFVGEPGARTRIGVVAWDGDRGNTGDRLTLSEVGPLRPLRWDGSAVVDRGSADNAFDSTATGWAYPNSLGVDAKGFAEVELPSGVGTLTPSTTGDQYLIGVVTVRTAPAAGR